jgi:predicted TIM-barrel fold metal-dependent hydrolase
MSARTADDLAHDLASLKIIDTDTHLSEPYDLWTSRAPAAYRDRVPQVKEVDGKRTWVVDRDVLLSYSGASSVVRRDGRKAAGVEFMRWQLEDVHAASYDVKARLAVMDRFGIHAQIVYPNLAGFGNQRFLALKDAQLRGVCATIYNDAMAELQHSSGQRIFPMALMPWWDIEACAREVQRAAELGLRGVVTCSDPDTAGLPDLADRAWDPFWDACGQLDMPICFHIGASDVGFNMYGRAPWPSMGPECRLALGSANIYLDNARVLGNLLYSGVPERFPRCRFVSVESGIGWIPFFLEALDYQFRETVPTELAHLKLLPSEYFHRQVYGCFWFESTAPRKLIEDVGADNVMFETDFPHPTCLYPRVREHLAEVLADIDPLTRRKVLQDNAAQLYRIPL